MRKRNEDKIYKTQIQISLEIDTLSVIERFKEQYKENGNDYSSGAYADHIRTASRLTSGHSAEVDSYTLPIYIRTI